MASTVSREPAGPTLVVLRHAKSDWSTGLPDLERPLAQRGLRQAPEAGRWLAEHIGAIDLALVSPARRTRSTWDLVAAELDPVPASRVEQRLYTATVAGLVAVLRELSEDLTTVALVGHNPGVEDLVERLTGELVELKTSAIAVVNGWDSWAAVGEEPASVTAAGRPPR
jgi:phosphohistidine phosphatase